MELFNTCSALFYDSLKEITARASTRPMALLNNKWLPQRVVETVQREMEAGGGVRKLVGKRKTVFCADCSRRVRKIIVMGKGYRYRDTTRLKVCAFAGDETF